MIGVIWLLGVVAWFWTRNKPHHWMAHRVLTWFVIVIPAIGLLTILVLLFLGTQVSTILERTAP